MKKFISLFLVFSILALSGLLQAQICFRGKPAPECKMFFLTEIDLGYILQPNYDESDERFYFNLELGGMYNLNKQSAVGGTFFGVNWGPPNCGTYSGFKVRYRQWLSSSVSLDISPGLSLWGEGKHPQFKAHISLNYKDLFALIVQVDVRRFEYIPKEPVLSLGIKFGSYTSILAFLGGALIRAITLID